jgi:hypothetical protein
MITQSSAVVHVLSCPKGTKPIWQPLRIRSLHAFSELAWWGTGHAEVCGVRVSGVETEMILACQRKDGTHHGPVGSWYEDGQKRTEGRCRRGVPHGLWQRYHRDGRKAVEGRFERGRRVGTWTVWLEDGRERSLPAARAGSVAETF